MSLSKEEVITRVSSSIAADQRDAEFVRNQIQMCERSQNPFGVHMWDGIRKRINLRQTTKQNFVKKI